MAREALVASDAARDVTEEATRSTGRAAGALPSETAPSPMLQKFIQRPVLAIVISIVIVFLGVLAIQSRPISQFPQIAPPVVSVTISYPGASAQVLVEAALIPIERSINGVPGMRYMTSDATSAGEATIQVIFEPGSDPDLAVVNVKNRVDPVMALLPELVRLEGVVVTPVQPSMLMYVNLYSTDPNADETFLYNFANVHLVAELQRIHGLGRVTILGNRQYAMRIWLRPDRMRAYDVSIDDVMEAIAEQSIIGRPGRTGQASGRTAQSIEYVLTYSGRYSEPEEYGNIIVRATSDGEILHLRDIAEVELGSEFQSIYSNLDGHPSAAIVLKQNYGSNASEVIDEVKAMLDELEETTFPPGMHYSINYDVSTFLDASIEQVMHTLGEAFILVALVVFLFLGDWRSTLIPTLAVPVSLIGAFVFMQAFDLTINLITLFALVLAIGIVVDDAIVVVEAVHAKMADEHIGPYAAVKKVTLQPPDKFRGCLNRIFATQVEQVAISRHEDIGVRSDECRENRHVLRIARDLHRQRVQIDDVGPDVELPDELLDPLFVPLQLSLDLGVAEHPADFGELLDRHRHIESGLKPCAQNTARRAVGGQQTREQHVRIENDLHLLRRRVRASPTASSTRAATCSSVMSAKARASSSRI